MVLVKRPVPVNRDPDGGSGAIRLNERTAGRGFPDQADNALRWDNLDGGRAGTTKQTKRTKRGENRGDHLPGRKLSHHGGVLRGLQRVGVRVPRGGVSRISYEWFVFISRLNASTDFNPRTSNHETYETHEMGKTKITTVNRSVSLPRILSCLSCVSWFNLRT